MIKSKDCPTHVIDIYISGSKSEIKKLCREFCFKKKICVSLTDVDFVYTGGSEYGNRISVLAYPKYPIDTFELNKLATQLATFLLERTYQRSCSIVGPKTTTWLHVEED